MDDQVADSHAILLGHVHMALRKPLADLRRPSRIMCRHAVQRDQRGGIAGAGVADLQRRRGGIRRCHQSFLGRLHAVYRSRRVRSLIRRSQRVLGSQ
ncbi:hypothetical protein G6F32_015776 [Rhizopus arrhizus]|nr:hypothetical protein G6F32_015776 [Rhizopus arrhizus]